ncbi:MAG: hypothetical protein MJA31_06895, partial [Clostridia bacterium]|nr:hypothetical protein [Clostridia bacterium]
CKFDGNMRNVISEPIYVQKVYDAILFNLQGLKTVSGQGFKPRIPSGHRIKKVLDIRSRKYFSPEDIDDSKNLSIETETTISGASFVEKDCKPITVIGPDGTPSEKIIYADTSDCDDRGRGTSVYGTQNIKITGNVIVEMDVLIVDRCDCESTLTLTTNVPIATSTPLLLTNFFEICIPSTINTAFFPRFTEFCNVNCEVRLATNNSCRDLVTDCESGSVKANLIIALCVTCEKKIVVPVQLCVLSTGFVQLSPQMSPICSSFPQLFPDQVDEESRCRCGCTEECCEEEGSPSTTSTD